MDRASAREMTRLLEERRAFVRAVVVRATGSVPGKVGASMIVRDDGTTLGTVGGAALEERIREYARVAFEHRRGDLHHFELAKWREGGLPSLCGGAVDVAVEYVAARPHLLLWGGGHVAHAFAQLLPGLDYEFSVADDRPDWVSTERFPMADRREVVPPEEVWNVFEPKEYTHLYLLGYDAAKDLLLLRRTLDVFPNFIGLIASAPKRAHMFASLRSFGVREEALARVHSPVGTPIGAESPAEIAVSMLAEVIQGLHPERKPRVPRVGRARAPPRGARRRAA
jgi:xanthine dehydrogenase accessory factor